MTKDNQPGSVHYRACHLCEAICGVAITVEEGRVTSVKGDADDPFSRGHVCPKAVTLKDVHEDPDRLRQPMIRSGKQWRECGWEEAYAAVAEGLAEVIEKQGPDAVAIYLGNPTVHNWGMMTHSVNFHGLIRTRNRYSATSVDQLPHQLICHWMYGHQLMVPVPDVDRSQFFLIIGGNPMASNGSLMTVPDFRGRMKALRARGGRLVVVDPRRTETAEIADDHVFIRPGTDAWFLLALLNVIITEHLDDLSAYEDFLGNWHQVGPAIAGFTPERAEEICRVPSQTIREIARALADADGAVCYGRMGVSVQRFGTLCQWAIQLINIAAGNLDRPGGSMFTLPAVDTVGGPNSRPGHFNRWQSRVRGLPEFSGELPVAALAEEILTPGDGQVRALITGAGNPVLSTPNGQQLDEALEQLDFMVSVDFYLNETTRHARVILPPSSPLERDHFDLVFNVFAVRNVARYSPATLPKAQGARHDWEILTALGERLAQRLGVAPKPSIPPTALLQMGLRAGPYGRSEERPDGLDFESLAQQVHGVDLGPLQPCLPGRLQREDRMIDCAPERVLADLERLAAEPEPSSISDEQLLMIGRRHVRSNNSWGHNYRRLVKGKPRHQLQMHPTDAQARQLTDGQLVRLRSRVGEVTVDLQLTDAMMPGVVSLPHGWGHDRKGVRLRVASERPGVSMNDLTDESALDVVSGNAVLNGVPVTVYAAESS